MVYDADLNEGFFNSLRYLNKYYGITRNPITEDFIIIMKHYKLGSLKDYITKNFYNIKWNEKIKILKHIVAGLNHLHNQKIIHRDFHSGNVLYENEIDIVISDLGISKSAISSTKSIDNVINDSNKSRTLSKVIKSAESLRSSKSQSITSTLGK